MDRLDFDLLAALARHPRGSYEELGVAVGLSANALRARLHRLQDEGVLQAVLATPRPALLGLSEGLLHFTGVDDLDEREDEILAGLADVPGVRFADAAHDHAVWVWTLQRDEADAERIERAAISLVGKPPARRVLAPPHAPERELAPADWRILRALHADGRAAAKELAARAGLTFKPLKRRLAALVSSGDVRIHPVVSPADASGHVLHRVVAFLTPDADATHVMRQGPQDGIVALEAPGVMTWLLLAPTLRDARTQARAIGGIDGVERAHLQIGTRRAALGWPEIPTASPQPLPVAPRVR